MVIYSSSIVDEAEFEGDEEIVEEFDMLEETMYHSGPFEGICWDGIGVIDISEELFGSYLEY